MNKNIIIIIILLSAILSGCKPSREKSVTNIQSMETSLYSEPSVTYNKVRGDSLLQMYEDFITRFPSDTLAPVFLFRAANLKMTEGDGNRSLSLLDRFMQKFPDHPKAPVCLFFKAFVYENLLRNLALAKETYLLYIEKYPNGEFVKDAQMSVQNLGKTPDQMIKEFEAMQRFDSVRKADSIANLRGKKSSKAKS
jgi:outer membrane protein assembly factor BamD (BamD/ComL family)